uniref:Protein YIF1 n=1 Tax=Kalmanozyma brasiliensis (strain GHG001) TaxID=1365824 RepID=V5EUC8_KALBG
MYQPQGDYPSRSPPPLQHPIPTHPPFKVPDPPISPNPVPQASVTDPHVSTANRRGGPAANVQASSTGGYQRFASPPIQSPPGQPYSGSSYAQPGAGPNQSYFGGGAPGQQQGWGAFGGFGAQGGPPIMNDATAQMGVQFGQHMAAVGGEYVQKNFNALLPMPVLKHYFNVSNSPDLYIPTMAFVTYIIVTSVILGLESRFHPEVLGLRASRALAIILVELAAIKLGTYLLNIQGDHTMMDLLAYSGYKFVGTLITLLVGLMKVRGLVYWSVFLYCFAANAFFLLRSLRYVVLPDPSSPSSQTITHAQRGRRIQFLFCIAVVQIVFGWALIIGIFKEPVVKKLV